MDFIEDSDHAPCNSMNSPSVSGSEDLFNSLSDSDDSEQVCVHYLILHEFIVRNCIRVKSAVILILKFGLMMTIQAIL